MNKTLYSNLHFHVCVHLHTYFSSKHSVNSQIAQCYCGEVFNCYLNHAVDVRLAVMHIVSIILKLGLVPPPQVRICVRAPALLYHNIMYTVCTYVRIYVCLYTGAIIVLLQHCILLYVYVYFFHTMPHDNCDSCIMHSVYLG